LSADVSSMHYNAVPIEDIKKKMVNRNLQREQPIPIVDRENTRPIVRKVSFRNAHVGDVHVASTEKMKKTPSVHIRSYCDNDDHDLVSAA